LNLMQANSFTARPRWGEHWRPRFPGGSLRIRTNSLGPNALSNSVQTLSIVGASAVSRTLCRSTGRRPPSSRPPAGSDAATVQRCSTRSPRSPGRTAADSGDRLDRTYTLTFNGQSTTLPACGDRRSDSERAQRTEQHPPFEVQDILVSARAVLRAHVQRQTTQPSPTTRRRHGPGAIESLVDIANRNVSDHVGSTVNGTKIHCAWTVAADAL